MTTDNKTTKIIPLKYHIITILVLVIVSLIGMYNIQQTKKPVYLQIDNRILEKDTINGVYNHAGYFCVVTKNREPEEIARTTFHELTHYFNHQYTDHFLERYKK